MTFLDPWLLLLVVTVPLGAWLRLRRGDATATFAPARLARDPALPSTWRSRLIWLPTVLHALALITTVVAIARPVERIALPARAKGIDILLCVDISSSMEATDLDPQRTRLDVAKEAATSFVDGRQQDRFGLICFARYADVLCPLTLDHVSVGEFLAAAQLVTPDGPEDATGIGTAVARAARVLRRSTAKSKAIVLLTDGEENVASPQTPDEISPREAADACAALGIRVYTIAAGTGKRVRSGRVVDIDTSQVEELATRSGGEFFTARDAKAIGRVYAKIDELERVEFEEARFEVRERFGPFVVLAITLLVAGLVLRGTALKVTP